MVCSGSGEITGIIETCQTPSTLEFAVGTFDMDFTLRHEDVDGDDGGSSLWPFPALFSALSLQHTHARTHAFAALTTNGRFLSLQTCSACVHNYRTIAHTPHSSVLSQTSPAATVHILGYRHISACLCALPRLLALEDPASSFLQSQSRMIQANMSSCDLRQTDRQLDRPGPSEPTPTPAVAIDQKTPTLPNLLH
jgi:hypothetical protein